MQKSRDATTYKKSEVFSHHGKHKGRLHLVLAWAHSKIRRAPAPMYSSVAEAMDAVRQERKKLR